MKHNFCILIPAYKPGNGLIDLVNQISHETACNVVVVDDGSGAGYKPVFDAVRGVTGCHVISYETNGGKGYALKKGFQYCAEQFRHRQDFAGVVTADADGQHILKDILKVGKALSLSDRHLVLGVRSFGKDVPLRSKLGNNITIMVYRLGSGRKVTDTQTGLRGIPFRTLPAMIELEGDRYEYEMNMLMGLKEMELEVTEVPIETVYIDDNSSSHFNPLKDSIRIYSLIFKKAYMLKYVLSSVAAFLVDYLISALLFGLFQVPVEIAMIPARVVSSVFNFFVNKSFVFQNKESTAGQYFLQTLGYFALVAFNLILIARPLTQLLVGWGISEYLALPIANITQFIISYLVQKLIIFRRKKKK